MMIDIAIQQAIARERWASWSIRQERLAHSLWGSGPYEHGGSGLFFLAGFDSAQLGSPVPAGQWKIQGSNTNVAEMDKSNTVWRLDGTNTFLSSSHVLELGNKFTITE